jgi:hypothetical protein
MKHIYLFSFSIILYSIWIWSYNSTFLQDIIETDWRLFGHILARIHWML